MIFRVKKFKKFILLLLLTLGLICGGGWWAVAQNPPDLPRPIITQTSRIQAASRLIYAQIPDFPAENQYVDRRSGMINPDDTLVSRLLRYHMVTKTRVPNLRFDWKMTLADYLDINEPMFEDRYPGTDTLQPEPMRTDRAVVSSLTLAQRSTVINLLVAAFTPGAIEPARLIFPTPPSTGQPSPSSSPSQLLPQPGDAQFLRF